MSAHSNEIVEMCLPTCDGSSCSRVCPVLFFSCQDNRRYEQTPWSKRPGNIWIISDWNTENLEPPEGA